MHRRSLPLTPHYEVATDRGGFWSWAGDDGSRQAPRLERCRRRGGRRGTGSRSWRRRAASPARAPWRRSYSGCISRPTVPPMSSCPTVCRCAQGFELTLLVEFSVCMAKSIIIVTHPRSVSQGSPNRFHPGSCSTSLVRIRPPQSYSAALFPTPW